MAPRHAEVDWHGPSEAGASASQGESVCLVLPHRLRSTSGRLRPRGRPTAYV